MTPDRYKWDAQQDACELAEFLRLVQDEGVESYCEVGCRYGGLLWKVALVMPRGSMVVAVDMPHGDRSTEPHLRACVEALRDRGYEAHLVIGDSTDKTVVDGVASLAPYDLLMIDANHTLPYVTKDWLNYGALAYRVAFHDIAWVDRPGREGRLPIEVPKVWEGLKPIYRHVEIRHCPRDNGIGVLWR